MGGLVFYFAEVGKDSTNVFSVLFGTQWLLLAIISVVLLAVACRRKSKPLLLAGAMLIASLVIVMVPAQIVLARGMYVAWQGEPDGPLFNCLLWNNQSLPTGVTPGADTAQNSFGLCTIMSIPSLNKFLIDRSSNAPLSDGSLTYYLMFGFNEAILVGGIALSRRKLLTH